MRDAHLVDTTKLEVYVQVLFVESLKARVEQPAQQWALYLFHHLRTSLLRIVLGDGRAEFIIVEVVLSRELVR